MRVAAVSGAALMLLMFLAAAPGSRTPIVDDHVVYALVLVGLALIRAGDALGFGRAWRRLSIVQRYLVLE